MESRVQKASIKHSTNCLGFTAAVHPAKKTEKKERGVKSMTLAILFTLEYDVFSCNFPYFFFAIYV